MADGNLEKMLRGGLSASPQHKEALRRQLFEDKMSLSLEDLAQVSGGVTLEEPKLLDWPDEELAR